ncbi:MAG TPA: hypothetical protein VG994_11590 [Steroidobacteraceae bacterium]|nr:hypothetical protein [Steroidobacteraceae bacterium]
MAAPFDPRSPRPDTEAAIERLVDSVLRRQPPRSAPPTLQARVLAEIERRAALPWWHHSFLHWPLVVRIAFILALLGVVKLALSGVMMALARLQSQPLVETLARPLSWAHASAGVFSKIASLAAVVFQAFPPIWLYMGAGVALTLYLALVILGTTAYRTLYVNK